MYHCQEMTQHTSLAVSTLWYLQNWWNNHHFSKTYYATPFFNISTFHRSWKICVQDLPSHSNIKHMMLLEQCRLSDIFTGENCIDLLLNFWQEPAASSFHTLARQKQGAQVWILQEQGQQVINSVSQLITSLIPIWQTGTGEWVGAWCHQQGINTQPPKLSSRLSPRHSPTPRALSSELPQQSRYSPGTLAYSSGNFCFSSSPQAAGSAQAQKSAQVSGQGQGGAQLKPARNNQSSGILPANSQPQSSCQLPEQTTGQKK